MKAYLVTTGAIFGLIAVLHLLRDITERSRLTTDTVPYLAEAALGLIAAALAVWAWRLFRAQGRS
jgi:ABC-type cobalamin transport system permease subunit